MSFLLTILAVVFLIDHLKTYDIKMYFFNAGAADAILISKDDSYMMIDTGEESLGDKIIEYLNKNNIKKLDYLIITHFDKDHVGSASKIIDNVEIGAVLTSNSPKDSTYYYNYISSLKRKNIEPVIVSGDYKIVFSGTDITINGPTITYDNNESNNSSLIVTMKYLNNSFLFMGDSLNPRIKDFLEDNSDTYDFLKVPYHGRYLKRDNDLLSRGIKYAVITNDELDSKTKILLEKYHVRYAITTKGVTVYSDGNNIKVKQ